MRRSDNNCSILSRSGYICIWWGERDRESTNHNARFGQWKSRYIIIEDILVQISWPGILQFSPKTVSSKVLHFIEIVTWHFNLCDTLILLMSAQFLLFYSSCFVLFSFFSILFPFPLYFLSIFLVKHHPPIVPPTFAQPWPCNLFNLLSYLFILLLFIPLPFLFCRYNSIWSIVGVGL